jgi:hypothetical protein
VRDWNRREWVGKRREGREEERGERTIDSDVILNLSPLICPRRHPTLGGIEFFRYYNSISTESYGT